MMITFEDKHSWLNAIKVNSHDHDMKLVFADWLEEQGDHDLSVAMRWCGENKRHPYCTPTARWFLWRRVTKRNGIGDKGDDGSYLPTSVFLPMIPSPNKMSCSKKSIRCHTQLDAFLCLSYGLKKMRKLFMVKGEYP
jgi:uncharacterized protein (TIGR02996 family)